MEALELLTDQLETRSGRFSILATAVSIIYLAWLIAITLTQYFRLGHIPGPRLAGFSNLWLARSVLSGRMHLDLHDVILKYGPDVPFTRISPKEVTTRDSAFMRNMLRVQSEYQKSDWYNAMRFNPERDNILSIQDNELHSKYREKLAPGYTGRDIDHLEPRVDRNVLDLVNMLDREYISKGLIFDFGRKAQYFTLDVISDVSFGQAFGFVKSNSDKYDYLAILEAHLPHLIMTSVYPGLVELMRLPILKKLFPSERDEVGFGRFIGIAKETAAARYGPDAITKHDMLGSFVAHGLTQADAESEILVQIVAGSDTTATALRTILLHIITCPRVFQKLYAEITEAGIPSRPWNAVVSDAEARGMKYLQAIIKEGLRVHPPAVGTGSKVVPPGGDTWKGVYLPAGTKVGFCMWGLMRNPEVWGNDADEFRPERWLETEGDKLREMEATLELVFGMGRWQCLGRNVALMELNKVFVELLRRFELVVYRPMEPLRSMSCGLFIQNDFWIKGYKR
ncbi:hypothetical protein OQA88_7736 [Cercophora sp. LCS_1]